MSKFKAGDVVEFVRDGIIKKEAKMCDKPSKYEELKQRIEKVEGWTKEETL